VNNPEKFFDAVFYAKKIMADSRQNTFVVDADIIKTNNESNAKISEFVRALLKDKEITAYFQPLVNTKTGKLFGVEALSR
jgi:sensor c-di-GMP phosphodiesterase-like protein